LPFFRRPGPAGSTLPRTFFIPRSLRTAPTAGDGLSPGRSLFCQRRRLSLPDHAAPLRFKAPFPFRTLPVLKGGRGQDVSLPLFPSACASPPSCAPAKRAAPDLRDAFRPFLNGPGRFHSLLFCGSQGGVRPISVFLPVIGPAPSARPAAGFFCSGRAFGPLAAKMRPVALFPERERPARFCRPLPLCAIRSPSTGEGAKTIAR